MGAGCAFVLANAVGGKASEASNVAPKEPAISFPSLLNRQDSFQCHAISINFQDCFHRIKYSVFPDKCFVDFHQTFLS
jgi:hypothetical protein